MHVVLIIARRGAPVHFADLVTPALTISKRQVQRGFGDFATTAIHLLPKETSKTADWGPKARRRETKRVYHRRRAENESSPNQNFKYKVPRQDGSRRLCGGASCLLLAFATRI